MEKPITPSNTNSATARIDDPYESIIVPSQGGAIDDSAEYGNEHSVPQIVIDDNKGWG